MQTREEHAAPAPEVIGLSALEAYEMLQSDPRALLIDIRSSMEFLFVGHPKGAQHISWIDEPDWTINPHFAAEVRKLLLGGIHTHSNAGLVPVILICRSGNRSIDAGETLLQSGFDKVFHVADGFEGPLDPEHHRSTTAGWRYSGLPWEQC